MERRFNDGSFKEQKEAWMVDFAAALVSSGIFKETARPLRAGLAMPLRLQAAYGKAPSAPPVWAFFETSHGASIMLERHEKINFKYYRKVVVGSRYFYVSRDALPTLEALNGADATRCKGTAGSTRDTESGRVGDTDEAGRLEVPVLDAVVLGPLGDLVAARLIVARAKGLLAACKNDSVVHPSLRATAAATAAVPPRTIKYRRHRTRAAAEKRARKLRRLEV